MTTVAPASPVRTAVPPRSEMSAAGRIVIEHVTPEIDAGRYPVKRVVGDRFVVSADIFRDGHDRLAATLLLRCRDVSGWSAVPMRLVDNDRWSGGIALTEPGRHVYAIEAWTDLFASWRDRIVAKHKAGQDVGDELVEGRNLLAAALKEAEGEARAAIIVAKDALAATPLRSIEPLLTPALEAAMARFAPRADVARLEPLPLTVDRLQARFSAWYEMVPRSQGTVPGKSATFRDCIARLGDIAAMGFDTIYLPPIHPIGKTNRKGRDNVLTAAPSDPGSPYAIGSAEGGHDAVHPELGTLADFRDFVAACRRHGMEVALDFAVQCSLDHPWIKQHPDWFDFRPDGTIRYAENPPKKYQDIVNLNFNAQDWRGIWRALRDVVAFWVEQGVRVFRVDNPHTKPYPFWEWLIGDIQADHPDVIFLAEAFTRPKPMRILAKLGFSQSYTYFTWRNEKAELTEYFTELTRSPMREYYRPHLFANTPDILPKFLQTGGMASFRIRAALAATLGGLWGIYNGFELGENRALPDSEEYASSEKYEYKVWDWDRPGNIKPLIASLNRLRRERPAFSNWLNLEFLPADNPRILFYARWPDNAREAVFVAVSLDPFHDQAAAIDLPLERLGIGPATPFTVRNLISGETLRWIGARQRVWIGPGLPVFAFALEEGRHA